MSLADQKVGTTAKAVKVFSAKAETPLHPKLELRFFEVHVTCSPKGGDNPHPNLETRFLKLVSLADRNAETTPSPQSKVGT